MKRQVEDIPFPTELKGSNKLGKLTLKKRIETAWQATPVIIDVKEIRKASEMPDGKSCEKNRIFLGIIRGRRTDCLIVVKYHQTFCFRLDTRAEELSNTALRNCGIIPDRTNMVCRICQQFSTYLSTDGMCYDCSHIQFMGRPCSTKTG